MKKILIYTDEGANKFCIASLVSALQLENIDQKYHIVLTNKDFFQNRDWQKETRLLIFPGGRDIPYHTALQGLGNQHIRDFVENGGHFLGICAGGYYGSAIVEFEKNGPLEVIAARELQFFPGTARGPAYGLGKFDYQSEKGAQIAKIDLVSPYTPSKTAAYFNGGCAFLDAEQYSDISVLGRYADIEGQPAAIIQCRVGHGIAILSGVHPEYSALHRCTKAKAKKIPLLNALQEIEKERRALFSMIMNTLL